MSKRGRTAAKNRHEYQGGEEEEETELINAFEQFPPPACPLLRFSALALPPEATYHNTRSSRAKSEAARRRRWTPRAPVFFLQRCFFLSPQRVRIQSARGCSQRNDPCTRVLPMPVPLTPRESLAWTPQRPDRRYRGLSWTLEAENSRGECRSSTKGGERGLFGD